MALRPSRNQVTEGRLLPVALRLALPMVGSALLHDLFQIVDLYFVSRLGESAVAAVTASATIVRLLWMIAVGIAMGCTALVSQSIGRGDEDAAEKVAGQSLFLALVLSAMAAAAVPAIPWALAQLGAEPAVVAQGAQYLQVVMTGAFTILLSVTFAAALRGSGDAVTPLIVMGLANVLNIGLDWVLIFGHFGFPALGVMGSAVATIVSRLLSVGALGYIFFVRGHAMFHLRLRDLVPDPHIIAHLFRIGVYSSGQMLMITLSMLFLFRIVAPYGTAAVAAYGIVNRIRMMVLIPGIGLANAAATMVGQNLGAGKPRRAEHTGWTIAVMYVCFAAVMGVVLAVFAEFFVDLFNAKANPEVTSVGAEMLRWLSAVLVFIAVGLVLARAMSGAGDTLRPMLIMAATAVGLRLTLAWSLSVLMGSITGIWIGIVTSIVVQGSIFMLVFKRGGWKITGARHNESMRRLGDRLAAAVTDSNFEEDRHVTNRNRLPWLLGAIVAVIVAIYLVAIHLPGEPKRTDDHEETPDRRSHFSLNASGTPPLPAWCVGAAAPAVPDDAPAWSMPLDGTLEVMHRSGLVTRGHFKRYGVAVDPNFETVGYSQPRWMAAVHDRGLMIENGWTSYGWGRGLNVPGVMNLLDHAAASAESIDDTGRVIGFVPWGKTTFRIDRDDKVEGHGSLRVSSQEAAGAWFLTAPCRPLLTGGHVASGWVKGPEGATLIVEAVEATPEGPGRSLAKTTWPLTDEWTRRHMRFDLPKGDKTNDEKVEAIQLIFTLGSGEGDIWVDALQVEPNARYLGRRTPSTWMPGMTRRFSETLTLPGTSLSPEAGALAMWYTPTSLGSWNCLACWGNGWRPTLRLDVRDVGRRVSLTVFGKAIKAEAAIEEGAPVHLVATWDDEKARLFVNGKEVGSVELPPVEERSAPKVLALGGSPDATSPNIRADGILDDIAAWRRAPSADTLARLADDRTDFDDWLPAVRIRREGANLGGSLQRIFSRSNGPQRIAWSLHGLDIERPERGQPARQRPVAIRIKGVMSDALWAAPEEGGRYEVPPPLQLDPAFLLPGEYAVELFVRGDDDKAIRFADSITIVPARTPWTNTQVCRWNSHEPTDAADGFTIAGTWAEVTPWMADAFTADGVYVQQNVVQLGEPRRLDHPVDLHWGAEKPKPSKPDIGSEYVRHIVDAAANRLNESTVAMTALRAAVINSEKHSGSWRVSYDPATIALARDRFGLDLTRWRDAGKNRWKIDLPSGRLNPHVAPETIPDDRIVPLDNPIYAFHRWWHGSDGPTETVTDNRIAARTASDTFLTLCDPALRRPAIRTYAATNCVQDWTYYTDPKRTIGQVERLICLTRGRDRMVTSSMPQFLFKPGMAAPFAGQPTADMFREACWLVASRPCRVMTLWNYGAARHKNKQDTPEEIETALGGAPGWDDTARLMKEKNLKLFAWTPELRPAFTEMANTLWKPYGALLPRWRNAPRRVAVVYSFASDLFSGERWVKRGPLVAMLHDAGLPYDVLYDQDFEGPDPADLSTYDAILLPRCHALTRPTAERLSTFIKDGGTAIVDDEFKPALDGVTVLETAKQAGDDGTEDEQKRRETELLERYAGRTESPQFVEAMEALMRERAATDGGNPLADLLATTVDSPVRVDTPNVCWNLLEAEGAHYLVLVNDLRRPGRIYGRYGKVRERGVAQTARVTIDPALARHVYDLTQRRKLAPAGTAPPTDTVPAGVSPARPDTPAHPEGTVHARGRANNARPRLGQSPPALRYAIDLPPGGGVILMLTPDPLPEALDIAIDIPHQQKPVTRIEATVRLLPDRGEAPASGLVPIELILERPGGARSDLSRHACLKNGGHTWTIPIARNAPRGEWTLRVRELATKKEMKRTINIH